MCCPCPTWCLCVLAAVGAASSLRDPAADAAGAFGEWDVDEDGLPVYRFMCDQTQSETIRRYAHTARDSASPGESQGGPFWQNNSDSIFQIGNDRLVLLLSTFGPAQLRQDEGGPKLLNSYDPAHSQFGGGLGYLVDSETGSLLLSTFYTGGDQPREFGIGKTRRHTQGSGITLQQQLLVPYGTDSVVVSEVDVWNHRTTALNLSYYEVWGGEIWQLAFGKQGQRRPFQDANYVTEVRQMTPHAGLRTQQHYRGASCADCPAGLPPGASLWDEQPPVTFLVSSCPEKLTVEVGCSARAFFGRGGAAQPQLGLACAGQWLEKQSDAAMVLRQNHSIAAGGHAHIRLVYGYSPADDEAALDALVFKYTSGTACTESLVAKNGQIWKRHMPRFSVQAFPWVQREFAWHYGMTRQSMTFDAYFQENIIDQGTVYRYDWGFQGAARDPLQHVLPFIFTDASVVRSILRYTLKEMQHKNRSSCEGGNSSASNIPYYVVGSGIVGPSWAHPSDQELYLISTATEYVLSTRDWSFLEAGVAWYGSSEERPVASALIDSFHFLRSCIGLGEHGLLRMQTGDWNDVFVQEAVKSGSTQEAVTERAESAANAAMAAAVLPRFADVLDLLASSTSRHLSRLQLGTTAQEVRWFAAQQAAALRAHAWHGEWFSRAWVPINNSHPGQHDFPGGWACTSGQDRRLCLEPQPWALLAAERGSPVLSQAEVKRLVSSVDSELRMRSNLGATVLSRPFSHAAAAAGQHENGGVWASQNHPLVVALAAVNSSMAWDEWVKNSRVSQATHFPEYWPGLWSSSDVTTSHFSLDGQEGISAWPSMPVLCTHPHAWPLVSASRLAGLTFDVQGVVFRPAVPLYAGDYSFHSNLAGISRKALVSNQYRYEGHYSPLGQGNDVRIGLDLLPLHGSLPQLGIGRSVISCGQSQQIIQDHSISSGGVTLFNGKDCGRTVRWSFTLGQREIHV